MAVSTSRTGDPVYDTFIKRSLGVLLPDCIRELTECCPADPIEFISQSLYKAVDSELYKKEKEKYLSDLLKESAELQRERDERNARLESLLQAQRDSKEELKKARQDEIDALMHLLRNAELYGITLSPRTMRRLNMLKGEMQKDAEADRPLQLTRSRGKKGAAAAEGDDKDKDKKSKGPKGKWMEVEEWITTASGTVIKVKTRKWVQTGPGGEDEDGMGADSRRKGRREKDDRGSVFGERTSEISIGRISITEKGIFTYTGGSLGPVQPPDPLDKQLANADNPDIWWSKRFDCHTLYDHELYIRCDAAVGLDLNQHASPPRKNVRDYLDFSAKTTDDDTSAASTQRESQQNEDTSTVNETSTANQLSLDPTQRYSGTSRDKNINASERS